MGFSRKLSRSRLGRTANKIFSTTMAATFALTPLAQIASAAEVTNNIVRTDGTNINFVNHVADIYAEKVKNEIGINRFKYFDLAQGNIANLYFKEQNGSDVASKLVNLVQNQINVAGAVNAIKDGKIGGDLFFLSPKGMVVSGSGVINAGSLNVAVPTQDFFDKLSYVTGKDAAGKDIKEMIDLFNGSADAILGSTEITRQLTGEVAYPLNASGSIAVAGKINAANVARLAANEVNIEAGSLIRNAVDFSSIANVPHTLAEQNAINGTSNKLAAKATDDGIYILGQNDVIINGEIQANNGVADIQAVNEKTVNLGELKGDAAKLLDSQKLAAKANITIGETANIAAEEKVNIQATAKTKFTGTTVNAPDGKSGEAGKSAGEKVKAGIAESKGSGSLTDSVKSMLDKINVMLDENEATAAVTVKDGARIASDGNVAIKADASSESNMTLTIQPKDVGSSGSSTLSKLLVGGASYSKNKTTATVNIDAELGGTGEIKGDLDIAANAENVSKIKTTIKKANDKDGQSNTGYLTAAINVVNQSANAEANINKDISAKGNVDIKAVSNSTLDVAAGTAVDNNAAAATAINIVDTKTNAAINAKGNITSTEESVSLAAENKYDKIAIATDNAYKKNQTGKSAGNSPAGGSSAGNAGAAPAAGEDVVESSGTAGAAEGLKDLLGKNEPAAPAADAGLRGANKNADDKHGATSGDTEAVKDAKGTKETDKKPEQSKADDAKKADSKTGWNQYFDIGASVMTGNFANQATVNISGDISAKKDVTATAETNPANIAIKTSNTLTNTQKNAKLGAAAAVAVANMQNDASVIVQGGKLASTEGSIDLSANVKHNKTLTEAILGAIIEAGSNMSADLNAVKDAKSVDDVKEASKLTNLSNSLGATMSTESLTTSTDGNELSAVANGTVGIENVTNNANVYLGNAAIKAGKDVNLSAKVEGMDINKAGKFQSDATSGTSVGIGGTVGVQNTYNNSKVEATGKTTVDAGENISASAENNIINITSAIGGSKSSTLGLTGMVSYMGGESNARVNMLLAAANSPALQGKNINIGTSNTTVLGNMAGQLSESQAAAIGASVGVVSYDIYSNAKLGGVDSAKPITINADTLNVKTGNASYAANLAVAGASSQSKSAKNAEAKSDDVAGTSIKVRADKSSSGGNSSDSAKDTMIELQDLTADSDGKHKSDSSESQGESRLTKDSIAKDKNENATEQSKEKTEAQKKNASKVNIAAAGSAAWNDINTSAEVELANAIINKKSQDARSTVGVAAEDSAYIGAFSGAMALTKAGGSVSAGGSQGFAATLAGAVAGNDIVKKTSSLLNGVQITDGQMLQNTAINKGAQIAAGVALGSATKAGYGATGAGSVSLNYVDSKVHAELDKLGMTNGNLQNVASDSDIQIAGGISIDYAKNSAGIGAAVSVNKAANDIAATINSSTLKEVAKIHNEAASQLVQIGTAVSVGIAAGDKNAALLNGAVAANTLTNKLTSAIRGSNVTSDYHETWGGPDNIGGNSTKTEIAILAHDGAVKGNNIQVENSYVADTAQAGFDIGMDGGKAVVGKDMRSYLGKDTSVAVNTTVDAQGNKNNSLAYNNDADYELADGGNTIVAGAIGVAAGKTNAAIAGSAVYNKVENDFTAGMYDSSVTAYETDIEALNHTNLIGVAAGAAIAAKETGVAAAGSVAIQDISNNIDADINNSDIKRYKEHRDEENKWKWHRNSDLNIKAHDDSSLVTVAGQGTGATTAAAGMAWAQNNLANHANINIEGLQMEKYADGYVKASAANNAKVWAVGASAGLTVGGAQSIGGTLEGAFAGNIGRMDTNINVNNSFLSGTTVELTASQKGKLSAIAGDASATGKTAAVGGAVAINKLGTKDAHQQNKINLKDFEIMLGEQIGRANAFIKAEDADEILTVAAGGAAAAGTGIANVSMQGSVADTGIYRDTAAIADNVMLRGIEAKYYPSLSIEADRKSKVISTADALSVSAGASNAEISAAAGVSMVNMGGTVKASLSQLSFDERKQMTKLSVKAHTLNDIMNIGMGASVAAGTTLGAGVMGNVAINNIAVNTEAETIGISGKVSMDSVAVQANSQDRIRNYAGSLNVAAGNAAAGVGATVVVNNITGDTKSTLRDVTIEVGEAEAGEAVDYTAGSGDAQGTMAAQKNAKKGVLVSADSQHEIENVAVTAGVAVSSTVSADAVASVAVNKIAGKTSAVLGKHNISTKSNTSGDINVLANDSSRLSSTVVGAAASAAGEAAIAGAAAVDDSSFSRQVQAGMGDDWGSSSTTGINGDINVRATNAQSTNVDTYGAAAGAAGTAGVALTGSVSNENFASSAEASMTNVVMYRAKNMSVTADTAKKLAIGNGAYGVAGGIAAASGAVGVINAKDTSSTKAGMKRVTVNNTAATAGDADKNIKVLATNNSVLKTLGTTGSAAIGLGGAIGTTIGINNIRNSVETSLNNVRLNSTWNDFQAGSANKIKLSATNAAVSGSLAAVGVGVAINTIDSSTKTNISNSQIRADKADVTADEKRDFDVNMLGATVSGAGIATNVNINTIGKAVDDSYAYDGVQYSAKDIKKQAQAGLDKLDTILDKVGGAYADKAGIDKANKHDAEFGGTNVKAGVGVNISGTAFGKDTGSALPEASANSVQIASSAVNNGKISIKQGNASLFGGANVSVGITDVKNSNKLSLTNSTINAKNIDIAANNSGTIKQEVQQGAASVGGAVNVAVAKLLRSGGNTIDIQNSSLLAQSIRSVSGAQSSALRISALDKNSLTNKILGVSEAAGIAGGALVSNVSDQAKNSISIGNGSVLKHADYTVSEEKITAYKDNTAGIKAETKTQTVYKPEYGDIDITARNDNAISSEVQVGAVGAISGNAAVSIVDIGDKADAASGMTSINLTGSNTLQGKNINLISDNAVQANSKAYGVGAGLISAGGVVSKVNAYGGSKASLGSAKFIADAVNAKALNNQKLKAEANGISAGGVGIVANIAEANLNASTSVDAGNISLSKNVWVGTQKFTDVLKDDVAAHEEQTAGGTLNILAEDASSTKAESKGRVVGLAAASGTNRALASNASKVNVSLAASDLAADNLNVAANAKTSSTTYADGAGGGIIDISPQAAYVKNTNTSTANVDIKGSYKIAGDANIAAVNKNKTEMLADAMSATVLGGSGVEAVNASNQTAAVNIKAGTVLTTGGKADIAARNEYVFGAAKNAKYVLKGNGYGGITNEVASLANTISGTARVNIESGSSVVSANGLAVSATTRNNIKSDAYVYSLGVFSGNYLTNKMKITADDSVNQSAGSSLKVSGKGADLTLAAADSQNISANTTAETAAGLAGVTSAKAENNIERINTINANGDVYSKRNVNLYAGKFAGDELSNLKLDVSAEVYNKVGLPLGFSPTLNNKLNQKNTVNIGGKVRSVQDANIYADAGKESVSRFVGAYTVYGGTGEHKFISTTNGKLNVEGGTQISDAAANKKDNHVNISGSVTAGIANVQKVTIGEANKGLIVLTKDEYVAAAEYHKNNGTAMPDNYVVAISDADYSKLSDTDRKVCRYKKLSELISIKDNEGKDVSAEADISPASFSAGSYRYANSLKNRMNELTALMIEYPDGAAHAGYLAEYTRLADELVASGMATKGADGSYTIKNDTGVAYIDIPELIAAGGNINLQTDNVYGSGSLTAKGSPNIDIQNNTSLSINVGNLQVANPGGVIYYNGSAMKDVAAINAKNEDKGRKLAAASATGGTAGSINIANNFNGKNSFNYRNPETNQDLEAPIVSAINIKGNIFADNGTVNINNAQGNISISGDAASVVGKDVKMTAANGSISQDFTDDIVNVGGDVQNQYNSVDYRNTAGSGVISGTKKSDADKKGTGRIAGSNIYINATDVNINGLIQSGFDNYHVEIKTDTKLDSNFQPSATGTMTVEQRMEQIKNNNTGRNLSDSDVLGNAEYRLIAGGQSYNESKGCYEYIIPVYYNPSTGALLTPDVESGGGQIFISGRISSTGNGNIICLDGASDISIKNDLNNKLVTGKLLSNDVSGKITLADAVTNTLSVITRNNDGTTDYKVSALDSKASYTGSGGLKKDANGGLYFAPDENLRYNWTTGQQVGTTKTYEKQWQDTWWGLSDNSSSARDYLVDQTNKLTPTSTGTSSTVAKRNGAYIGAVTGDKASDIANNDYSIWQNNAATDHNMKVDEEKHWSSGFLWCHKNHYYRWTVSEGTEQSNFYSVNAHQNIKIGFIGKADGNSTVNVVSKGSIDLNGSVGNRDYAAAADGSLLGKGTVNISSANGSINQLGGSIYGADITLKAAGDIQNIDIAAGKDVNLTVGSLAGEAGTSLGKDVSITVNGYQGSEGNVKLTMADDANAGGRDSFALTTTGAKGNIETPKNSVIDARRIDLTSQNGSITALVNGGQQALGNDTLSASVNAKANGNITLTQTEGDMRIGRIYSDHGDVTLNIAKGSVVDALPYGAMQREDENTLIAKWINMGLFGDADNAMLKEKQAINDKANLGAYTKWNKDSLLYTIQDSIINPTSDTLPTTSSKDPNIKGNNITLNVANNAGIETGNVTNISMDDLDLSTTEGMAKLKRLSQADASNISWDKNTKSFKIIEKLPIGVQTNTAAGKLTVGKFTDGTLGKVDGNVFIEGRTQVDSNIADKGNKDLTIGGIMASGDVSISGLGNILNGVDDAGKAAITGKNLYISAAGSGSIGTKDKELTINLGDRADANTGILQAVGANGVYLNSINDNILRIKSISSGENIRLKAIGDIIMADKLGTTGAADSLIQTENDGTIELVSTEGSVGSVEEQEVDGEKKIIYDGVRIRNDGEAGGKSKVIVKAAKSVAIEGISSDKTGASPAGVLNVEVGKADAKGADLENIYLNSHGALNVADGLQAKNNISLTSSLDMQTNKDIIAGTLLEMNSGKGINITAGRIEAVNININAGENLTMKDNNVTGANIAMNVKGDVSQENLKLNADGVVNISGKSLKQKNSEFSGKSITLKADGDISQDNTSINRTGDINISSKVLSQQDVGIAGKNIIINAKGDALQDNVKLKASGNVNVAGKALNQANSEITGDSIILKADGDVLQENTNITANGDVNISGLAITQKGGKVAGKNITLNAQGDVQEENTTLNASEDVNIFGQSINQKRTDVVGKNLALNAKGDVRQEATAINGTGDVNISSKALSQQDVGIAGKNISINAKGDVQQDNVKLKTDGVVNVSSKALKQKNSEFSGKSITLKANGDALQDNVKLKTDGVVNVSSKALKQKNSELSGKSITLKANGDTLQDNVKLKASGDVNVAGKALNQANSEITGDSIILKADGDVSQENTNITANGDVNISGLAITQKGGKVAGKNITLNAQGDVAQDNARLTANEAVNIYGKSINQKRTDVASKSIALNAKGDVLQDAASALKANANTYVVGNGRMELLGTNNRLSSLTLDNRSTDREKTGTIRIVNGSGDIGVTMLNSSRNASTFEGMDNNLIFGNIDIQNNSTGMLTLASDHSLYSEGTITASSKGGINLKDNVADNEGIKLQAQGDIEVNGSVCAMKGDAVLNTQGNIYVTAKSADKHIYVLADKLLLEANGDVAADSNVVLAGNDINLHTLYGNIINASNTLAIDTFTMEADKGDITNKSGASFINPVRGTKLPDMSDNVIISAVNGKVSSEADIVAEKNVTIIAKNGLNSISKNIYAGQDILLRATDGHLINNATLESDKGNITLLADKGTVANGANGNIFAFGGNVTLHAGGDGSANIISVDGTDVAIKKGSVYNKGDILALDTNAGAEGKAKAGNIILESENADITNFSDFNTVDGGKTEINSTFESILEDTNTDLKSYNVAAKNITMSAAKGRLDNAKEHLVACGDVTLTAKEGLNSIGKDIYAGGDIKLTATDGTMLNKAKLVSLNGSVELTAENGSVINMLDGDIFAMGGDVKLTAGAAQEAEHTIYKINDKGEVEKMSGFAKPEDMADDAIIVTKKFYYTKQKDEQGNMVQVKKYIDADDRVSAHKGNIYTEVRYITDAGEEKALNIFADPNDSTKRTNILQNDDAEFFRLGDVVNRGDAVAMGATRTVVDEATGGSYIESAKEGTVSLESKHGNASNYDNFEAVNGSKDLEIDGRNVFNKNTGELYAKKKYMLSNGNISLRAPEGRFYNDFAIRTNGDLTMEGNYSIAIGKNFAIAEVGGNLNLISTKGKVVNDENSQILVKKDINIAGASGVVNKGEIISQGGELKVSSTGGDIVLGNVTGGTVIVSADKADGIIDVTNSLITADSYVSLTGDYVKGEVNVAHGDGYAGTMGFSISGTNGGAVKNGLKLNNDGNTRFDLLHVADGHIVVGGNGTLAANKVKAAGNLTFDVMGRRTTFLGRHAGKQNGQFIYANPGDWMNFYIDNPTYQKNNALLIHVSDFHYVDSQRFALDDLAGQLLDFNPLMSHRQLLVDNIGLFNRYNLYDSAHAKNDIAGFETDNVLDINSTDDGLELVGSKV